MVRDAARVKAIFLDALEHHPADRWPTFLGAACGDDAALRDRVERLLAAHRDQPWRAMPTQSSAVNPARSRSRPSSGIRPARSSSARRRSATRSMTCSRTFCTVVILSPSSRDSRCISSRRRWWSSSNVR